MEIYLKKTLSGLVPMPESEEDYKKIKLNEIRKCKITKPRNSAFHRKYFKLLNLVFENQERYKTVNKLLLAIKDELEMFDMDKSLNGDIIKEYHSISFSSMSQYEFEELYSKTLDLLSKFLGLDKDELVTALLNQFM